MAASTKFKLGVIAEENNDVEVLYELTCKLTGLKGISVSKFVGHGCGRIRKKCASWARNLVDKGCTHIVVLHDCDRKNEADLRTELQREIEKVPFRAVLVLIPIEELEAWLLSDPLAIKTTFNMRALPKIPKNPEGIASPKEYLGKLVRKHSKATYLNTVHNAKIAKNLALSAVKKCQTFLPYPPFISPKK